MTEGFNHKRPVVLTKTDVRNILIWEMGWEEDDADLFWQLASLENNDPGFLERDLGRQMQQALGTI